MPLKADAAKAAEAVAANAAAATSVNGEIAKLQQDITAAFAAKQTQVNNARAELATLMTRQTNLQNGTTALNAEIEVVKGNGRQKQELIAVRAAKLAQLDTVTNEITDKNTQISGLLGDLRRCRARSTPSTPNCLPSRARAAPFSVRRPRCRPRWPRIRDWLPQRRRKSSPSKANCPPSERR